MLLQQKIERVGPGEFNATVKITDDDGNAIVTNRTYTKSNSIYPAYKSLIYALHDESDCTIKVESNHVQLMRELFEQSNKNTTLSNILADLLAKNNIKLIKN